MGQKKSRFDFPIKYFEGNLFFNGKSRDCWAVYKLSGVTYEFHSADVKRQIHQRLSRFIANIGDQAKIFMIPIAQDFETIYDNIEKKTREDEELGSVGLAHAKCMRQYLKDKLEWNGNVNDYDCYLCVKLRSPAFNESFRGVMKAPMDFLTEFLTSDSSLKIRDSELRAFNNAAKRYCNDQSKRMRLEPIDSDTAQWLIRRMFLRGTGQNVDMRKNLDGSQWTPHKTKIRKHGKLVYTPLSKDILTLCKEKLTHKKGRDYVVLTNPDGVESYQMFLPFSHIPDGIELIGGEWLYMLQDLPVATEVCITLNLIEYQNAIKKIDRNYDEVKGQIKHVNESNEEIPEELYEAGQTTAELKNEIKAYKDPLVEVGITLCVASDDLEKLREQASTLITTYKDNEFHVQKPFTDQMDLFYEFIPGGPIRSSDYIFKLPPSTIAGTMFPVKKRLGDDEGHYVGTTGIMEKMVFLTLSKACRTNRSASAAFLGTLGGGKSFNANLMLYHEIMLGGKGLIIDPKGERSNWIEDLPELKGHINIINLTTAEEDRGKLDPFIIYQDNMDEAVALASSMLIDWLNIVSNTDEDSAIAEALNKVKVMEQPCMTKLVEALESLPEDDDLYKASKRIARKIRNKQDIGMTKLIFGTGQEKALSFEKRVNILQIQNIQLPTADTPKDDYSEIERLSTVLMIPVTSFAKKFVQSERNRFKVVVLDESWALRLTPMGTALYNYLARTGRSQNAATIFIGHSAQDVDDKGIREALTFLFVFKVNTVEEAELACKILGIEQIEENYEVLMNLHNAQCMVRDLDGNVELLQFDAVYEHLIKKAFNTNPTEQEV